MKGGERFATALNKWGYPLALASGTLLAAAVLAGGSSTSRAAEHKPGPPLPPGLLGVAPNTGPTNLDLRRFEGAGSTTIREGLPWSSMQTSPDAAIDFTNSDAFMQRAAEHGMSVDLILGTTPRWARSDPDASHWVPPLSSGASEHAWLQYVRAAVKRYGRGGTFWQDHPELTYQPVAWTIWNEPNLERFWGGPARPVDFAKLVNLTGPVIRQLDPSAKIITGGIFCEWGWGDYLERFYDFVDKDNFDAVAFHPFAMNPVTSYRLLLAGRKIMRQAGDSDAQVWIDEIAWGTDLTRTRFVVTPEQQADNMRILFQILAYQRKALNLGKVLWFGIRDDPKAHNCQFCPSAGLWLADDTTPKPAWWVYKGFGSGSAGKIRGKVENEHSKPVAGESVYLDINNDGWMAGGEPRTTTGDSGSYSFPKLYATNYTIRLRPSDTQSCQKPGDCDKTVDVPDGTVVSDQDFKVGKATPNTKITKAKVKSGKRKAKFKFKGVNATKPYKFRCKLDHKRYRKCSSPTAYKHLKTGKHKFKVRAKDSRGAVDGSAATYKFKIKH